MAHIEQSKEGNNGLRRSSRLKNAPERYETNFIAFVCSLPKEEPKQYNNACKSDVWRQAMQMNMTTFKLLRYHVWELIGLPQGKRLIDSEWLYNIEHNAHGDVK